MNSYAFYLNRQHGEAAYARLETVQGSLALASSYSRELVDALKEQIPAEHRQWDKASRRWLVSPHYGGTVAAVVRKHLGVEIDVPKVQMDATTEMRLLRIEYVGQCKDRGSGELSAFAWADGNWSVLMPEAVLREWFEAVPQRPGEKPTLYAVLTIKASASLEEIRKAHRRLAMQWHPDRCHEPDAAEQFKAIQGAYEVLTDALRRKKYDAGLALQGSLGTERPRSLVDHRYNYDGQLVGFRSPLRCGWVLCEGVPVLSRFAVGKILAWEDMTDERGRVMVTSWPAGAKTFEVAWQ